MIGSLSTSSIFDAFTFSLLEPSAKISVQCLGFLNPKTNVQMANSLLLSRMPFFSGLDVNMQPNAPILNQYLGFLSVFFRVRRGEESRFTFNDGR